MTGTDLLLPGRDADSQSGAHVLDCPPSNHVRSEERSMIVLSTTEREYPYGTLRSTSLADSAGHS